MAGELSGFSVVLVTEQANPISNSFVSTPLADAMSQGGVNYAVLDDFVTPDAGMRLYGRSARQGEIRNDIRAGPTREEIGFEVDLPADMMTISPRNRVGGVRRVADG